METRTKEPQNILSQIGEENSEGLEAEERNHSMINAVDFRFCQHLFQSPERLKLSTSDQFSYALAEYLKSKH